MLKKGSDTALQQTSHPPTESITWHATIWWDIFRQAGDCYAHPVHVCWCALCTFCKWFWRQMIWKLGNVFGAEMLLMLPVFFIWHHEILICSCGCKVTTPLHMINSIQSQQWHFRTYQAKALSSNWNKSVHTQGQTERMSLNNDNQKSTENVDGHW
jgi:hypothetical protein